MMKGAGPASEITSVCQFETGEEGNFLSQDLSSEIKSEHVNEPVTAPLMEPFIICHTDLSGEESYRNQNRRGNVQDHVKGHISFQFFHILGISQYTENGRNCYHQ